MSHNGKSISVDFKYESRSDIAVPKLTIGSTHQQTPAVDLDLNIAKKIRKRRFMDFKSDMYDFL
jgi:hypothetical protein